MKQWLAVWIAFGAWIGFSGVLFFLLGLTVIAGSVWYYIQ